MKRYITGFISAVVIFLVFYLVMPNESEFVITDNIVELQIPQEARKGEFWNNIADVRMYRSENTHSIHFIDSENSKIVVLQADLEKGEVINKPLPYFRPLYYLPGSEDYGEIIPSLKRILPPRVTPRLLRTPVRTDDAEKSDVDFEEEIDEKDEVFPRNSAVLIAYTPSGSRRIPIPDELNSGGLDWTIYSTKKWWVLYGETKIILVNRATMKTQELEAVYGRKSRISISDDYAVIWKDDPEDRDRMSKLPEKGNGIYYAQISPEVTEWHSLMDFDCTDLFVHCVCVDDLFAVYSCKRRSSPELSVIFKINDMVCDVVARSSASYPFSIMISGKKYIGLSNELYKHGSFFQSDICFLSADIFSEQIPAVERSMGYAGGRNTICISQEKRVDLVDGDTGRTLEIVGISPRERIAIDNYKGRCCYCEGKIYFVFIDEGKRIIIKSIEVKDEYSPYYQTGYFQGIY